MSAAPGKPRLKLPIGIQTFREIREEGHYYADKTPHIKRMIDLGKHYFLSRPRRFGKSLLLDTIKELFEGSEELFRGLHIHELLGNGNGGIRWCGWTSAAAASPWAVRWRLARRTCSTRRRLVAAWSSTRAARQAGSRNSCAPCIKLRASAWWC